MTLIHLKVLIWKLAPLYGFNMKKELMEDEKIQGTGRAHSTETQKRHIPLVSLFLHLRMLTVHCFVWSLGLQPW